MRIDLFNRSEWPSYMREATQPVAATSVTYVNNNTVPAGMKNAYDLKDGDFFYYTCSDDTKVYGVKVYAQTIRAHNNYGYVNVLCINLLLEYLIKKLDLNSIELVDDDDETIPPMVLVNLLKDMHGDISFHDMLESKSLITASTIEMRISGKSGTTHVTPIKVDDMPEFMRLFCRFIQDCSGFKSAMMKEA